MKDLFHRFSTKTSEIVGSYWAFCIATLTILIWCLTGPMFHFSDTWQLVINTSTTIVTFLMVFLIQNTQNRDAKAMQLKLDELIRSHKEARNALIDLEDLSDEEINRLEAEFASLREQDAALHNSLTAVEKMIQRQRPKHRRKNEAHHSANSSTDKV